MAAVYSDWGKYAEAERYFREALTLGSNDAQTNYNMAVVLLGLDKNGEALDFAKKAVDADGMNAVYLYTYGLAGERNGMQDVAVQQYAKSIAADPKYPKPRINLGVMYLEANRIDEALNQLNAAFNLEKDNFEANNNLGKVYGIKGAFDRSVDHYARAVKKNPKDVEVRMNLAAAYISAGLAEKARDAYVEIIKMDGAKWDAYYELGKVYVSLGDKASAKAILQELLRKKPDYPKAADARGLVDSL
jgi:tetratricopeptide (TPR) repeat protein